MKIKAKALGVLMALTIFVLSSCHQGGCPGAITDTDIQQSQVDDNC